MRTTLTLDEDVWAKLEAEMHRTSRSFKETVNEVLRTGLSAPRPRRQPFRVRGRDLGLKPGYSLDNVEALLDQIEGPMRR